MLNDQQIIEIEKIIGYKFNNKNILSRAFRHNSAGQYEGDNYQRLEYLGDAILDFVVAERLMQLYPHADEGQLTQMRAAIVSKIPLASTIKDLGLNRFLQVGKGEKRSNVNQQKKVESDIFESIVAGIYYDSNLEEAKNFIFRHLDKQFENIKAYKKNDFKSELNEYSNKHKVEVIYETEQVAGMPHNPTFECKLYLNGKLCAEGVNNSKRAAEQSAAEKVVADIKDGKKFN